VPPVKVALILSPERAVKVDFRGPKPFLRPPARANESSSRQASIEELDAIGRCFWRRVLVLTPGFSILENRLS